MKERPILFSGEMVRAILEGRKTMTRRVMPEKIVNDYYEYDDYCRAVMPHDVPCSRDYEKSFFMNRSRWEIGDHLYVREAWRLFDAADECPHSDFPCPCPPHKTPLYRASHDDGESKWRPSIHMPRSASRITLEVTGVKVERLQDIRGDDARREGFFPDSLDKDYMLGGEHIATAAFREYWDSINAKRPGCSWADNPWVWAIEFKRVPQ